ncbi:MAG: hypothetical protein V4685_00455 [Bacteroidota bacterium]
MQENEFEKKLQQKMEALQVQPTGEVWEKIKEQVAQKKRRRSFAFFFLLIGLLVAGVLFSGQLNWFNKNEASVITANNTAEKHTLTEQIVETDSQPKTIAVNPLSKEDKNDGAENSNIISEKDDDTKTNIDNAEKKPVNLVATAVTAKDALKQTVRLKRKTNERVKTKVVNAEPVEEDGEKEMVVVQLPEDKEEESVVPVSSTNDEKPEVVKKPATNEIAAVEKAEIQISMEVTQPVKAKTAAEKNKNKKWGLAVNVSGGISAASYNNTSKNVAFTADGLNSNPGTGVPTANANTYYPSQAKPGIAFTAGVQFYRRLSNTVKLTSGLQYQFYSTSQKTGSNDSSQYNQVRTLSYGNGNTFYNRYHYVSLPVGLSVTLFNIGNKEVCADAGVNFSRLLKTNALAFDTANGYYYNNQAMFNKNFVGLSASVAINLAGKNKPALYIGPQFYYNITALAGKGMYANTHSRYIGIMIRKNLWK